MRLENAPHFKQELFAMFQTLYGFAISALVFMGIGCTIYKVISPDGWVTTAFGRSLSAGFATVGSLAALLALAWLSRTVEQRAAQAQHAF